MEKVSIVVPTRNRAYLLKSAITSVINQDYKNLEIIICDNFSADNTKEIVESFCDERIVYIKTDKPLSMPDNWEFALNRVTGDYVAYITDDSFLMPKCISNALNELQKSDSKVVVWKHCTYFSSNWLEPEKRNNLYIPKASQRSYILNSNESLKKLFNDSDSMNTKVPKSINSLCHRSIIEKVVNKQGRFFLPIAPDWSSAAGVLLNTENYLFIDKVFYIDSVTTASVGAVAAFNAGDSLQEFLKEFNKKTEDLFFLGIPVTVAGTAKSLEEVRKFYIGACPEINEKILLCKMTDLLAKLEANGADVRKYRQKIHQYTSQKSSEIKKAVAKQNIFSKIKWKIIETVRNTPHLRSLETLRNRLRNSYVLSGKKMNFNNIEECAKIAASFLV